MRLRDYFYLAAALLFGLFGLVMVLGAIMQLGEDGADVAGTLALGLGLGVLPLLAAVWLARTVLRSAARRRRELTEREVLGLAATAGGRLTPVQVAQSTSLTLEEAKAFLDHLGTHGHCRLDLAEDGTLSYRFDP